MSIHIASKYEPLDYRKHRFLGYQFEIKEHREGEKRCIYCGRWFVWSERYKEKYIANRNWVANRWGSQEPEHCGSLHCDYYHRRYLKADEERTERLTRHYDNLFLKLKKAGMVA